MSFGARNVGVSTTVLVRAGRSSSSCTVPTATTSLSDIATSASGGTAEPVAVALHDRHQAGSVAGHPVDALTPRGAVDRQPQRHDSRR